MTTYTILLQDAQDWYEDDSAEFVAEIPSLITRAEERIFKDIPNLPAFRTSETGTLTGSTATLAKPTGLRVTRAISLTVSSVETFLERRIDSYLRDLHPNATTEGQPTIYSEDDETNFRFAPTPDTTYTYTVYYQRKPTGLTSSNVTTHLGTNYYDMLLYCVLWRSGLILKDYDAAKAHKDDYMEESARVAAEVQRMYANEYGSGA